MKFVQLIFWFNVVLWANHLSAQTNLNPPMSYQKPANDEFDDLESDTFLQTNSDSKSVDQAKLGLNRNGEQEYSVLENKIRESDLQQDLLALDGDDSELEENSFESSKELDSLLTKIVLKHLPHEYTQDKKWGQQSKRWAGIKCRRDDDDGKLETKRRFKMVNHGTWQKYSAQLRDPNEKFEVRLVDVNQNRKGDTTLEILFAADLRLEARQAKWVRGVQLYSVSAEGDATVNLLVNCDVGMTMDLQQFPPDLIFAPVVTKAKINVESFKLDKVSKAGGEVAQQVTRVAKKELEAKIAEKEKKLVKKLNQEIEENRDNLRLSIADAIKLKWFDKAKQHLPHDIKEAIAGNSPVGKSQRNAAIEANRK